jgi:PWI domain
VVVDEGSLDYLEQFRRDRGQEDPITAQTRLDSARMALSNVLAEIADPSKSQHDDQALKDSDGDTQMADEDRASAPQPEIVTIPLTIDDELADIPAEMRETVAAEIAAFRDRSNRRDLERLKREEEIESMERARNFGGPRINRLASPPPQGAPSGPAGGTNGIPVGPRDRGVQGAPVGPKAFQGQQMPRDYQKGVAFVNGGVNGGAAWMKQDDEDTDASDEELERRRKEKKNAELEKLYLDQERRWLNRERSRTLALERERARDAEDEIREKLEREAMAKRLRDWNDDVESTKKSEEYYLDRSIWIRNRALFRQREMEMDERDRAAEEREAQKEKEKRDQARGMADQFLARQAEEIERNAQTTREPARFKLSLGAAAQRAHAAANPRRTVAEVEGLLEDEEESSTTTKRTLVPIKFDSIAEAQGLSEEEREQAVRQLAAEIPSEKDGLWKWPVNWEFVDEAVVTEKLKPFVERKIVEYLGVQEQMLVEVVEEHIRKRGGPQELVAELEGVSFYVLFFPLRVSKMTN